MNTRKVIAVIVLNKDNKFLIMKRSSDKKVHANLWNLPSGGIERGEGLHQAARREVKEETDLEIQDIQIGPSTNINVSNDYVLEINYLLAKTNENSIKLNEENSEYKWVTPEESLNFKFAVSKDEVIRILSDFKLL